MKKVLLKYYPLFFIITIALLIMLALNFYFTWEEPKTKAYQPEVYELFGQVVTKQEYQAAKDPVIAKVKNKEKLKTPTEVKKWLDIARRELEVRSITLTGVTNANIVEKLNTAMEQCSL